MSFGFLLYLQWEAMLISYLATRVLAIPFDGISSLLDDSDFQISLVPGSSYEDAFKTSIDPVWQKAWINRIQPYLEDYRPYGVTGNIQLPLIFPKKERGKAN